jgi:hypothetical protein
MKHLLIIFLFISMAGFSQNTKFGIIDYFQPRDTITIGKLATKYWVIQNFEPKLVSGGVEWNDTINKIATKYDLDTLTVTGGDTTSWTVNSLTKQTSKTDSVFQNVSVYNARASEAIYNLSGEGNSFRIAADSGRNYLQLADEPDSYVYQLFAGKDGMSPYSSLTASGMLGAIGTRIDAVGSNYDVSHYFDTAGYYMSGTGTKNIGRTGNTIDTVKTDHVLTNFATGTGTVVVTDGNGNLLKSTTTYLTGSETDPVFTVSAAAGITSTQVAHWDSAYVSGTLTVTQNGDTQSFTNNGTNVFHKWSDGTLELSSSEANTIVQIGKNDAGGSGTAKLIWQDDSGAYTTSMTQDDATFNIQAESSSHNIVVNDDSEHSDFRVESNDNAGMLFINGSTNQMGIGTLTPTTTLDVNGVITATGGNSTQWNLSQDSTKNPFMYYLGNTIQRGTGNVGIGTMTPTTLGINNSTTGSILTISGTDDGASNILQLLSPGDISKVLKISYSGNSATADTRWGLTSPNGVRIATNYQTGNVASYLFLGNYMDVPIVFGNNNLERMRIAAGGNVGINTTAPSSKLSIAGATRQTDTLMVGTEAANSHIHPGDALWTVVSDSTLKKNITPFTADLTKFSLIKPKSYKFKKEIFLEKFDEKTLKDTLELMAKGGTFSGTLTEMKAENIKIKVKNDSIKAAFNVKNDENADRMSSKVHKGFMAQDFNKIILNSDKLDIDYSEVLLTMWLKIQELEERIIKLEGSKPK